MKSEVTLNENYKILFNSQDKGLGDRGYNF